MRRNCAVGRRPFDSKFLCIYFYQRLYQTTTFTIGESKGPASSTNPCSYLDVWKDVIHPCEAPDVKYIDTVDFGGTCGKPKSRVLSLSHSKSRLEKQGQCGSNACVRAGAGEKILTVFHAIPLEHYRRSEVR